LLSELSLATGHVSLPVAYQLYLPEIWAHDPARGNHAGVPQEIRLQTTPEMAIEQIRWLVEGCLPYAPLLADAAYGNDNGFRDGLQQLHLEYAVGAQSSTLVWPPGLAPLYAKGGGGMGRPPSLLRREAHAPLSVKELALCLSLSDLRRVSWCEGTRGTMHSRLAALRVRVAHRDYLRIQPRPEQWLLIEWPKTEKEPTKYWLSTMSATISMRKLVATAKLRGRIERDYEELKQELGLGHFERRNWRGFHHHASFCIAACSFLAMERCLPPAPDFPPLRAASLQLRLPRLPHDAKPRGAAN